VHGVNLRKIGLFACRVVIASAGSVKDDPGRLHDSIYPTPRVAYYRDMQYLFEKCSISIATISSSWEG